MEIMYAGALDAMRRFFKPLPVTNLQPRTFANADSDRLWYSTNGLGTRKAKHRTQFT